VASQALGIGVKLLATSLPDTGSPGWWHGRMDDLGLWRRGLTAAEINAIFRAGCGAFALNEADLSAVLPTITQSPVSQTNQVGETATFTSAATAGGNTVRFRWLFNGAVLPGETSPSLTLANVQFANGGNYQVVAASAAGCVTSVVASLTINRPPLAVNSEQATAVNNALSIPHATLLAPCSDPDSDLLILSAAGPMSTNGAIVTLNATHVIYTPVTGFVGVDRFPFTISDGRGGLASATVVVGVYNPVPAYNRVSLNLVGGQAQLSFLGAPGLTYTIQRTPVLPAAWVSIGTAVADGAGNVNFTDTSSPAGSAFYQLLRP